MNKDLIYLIQTDTTVGFLSNDDKKLTTAKQRKENKKILQVVDSFKTLTESTRVPSSFKKLVRNSKKTTFIYPDSNSYRVVNRDDRHYKFIKKFNKMYSTSANVSGECFNNEFAIKRADIIVEDERGFSETTPSKIFKLSKHKIKKIR